MCKRLIMLCAVGGWCCWAGCASDNQVASEPAAHESRLAIVADEILGDRVMDASMKDIDAARVDDPDAETVGAATGTRDVGAADPEAVPRRPRGLGELCGGRPSLGPCAEGLVCVTPRTGNPFAGCTAECYGRCLF
jgi:hypothetical protein